MTKLKIPSKEASTAMVAVDDPVDDVSTVTASAVAGPKTAGEGSSKKLLVVVVTTLSVAWFSDEIWKKIEVILPRREKEFGESWNQTQVLLLH